MKKIFFGLMSILMLSMVGCNANEVESTAKPTDETAKPTVEPTVDNYKMTIASPGGAPGVAISSILTDYKDEYTYQIGLEPKALAPLFQKKEMDIIIAPINMGAKMYKSSNGYALGAVVTWGNLYLASQKPQFKLDDINGKELVIFGEGTINESVVKHILKKKNVVPSKITGLGDAKATQQQLMADNDGNKVYLVAEPSLTVAKINKPAINSLSVQSLYKEVSGANEFAQAGCFINLKTIDNHKIVVDKFLTRLSDSCDFTRTNAQKAAENAVALNVFPKKEPLIKAMPNCNIRYKAALESKAAIEALASLNAKDFGGAKPVDSFYYEG